MPERGLKVGSGPLFQTHRLMYSESLEAALGKRGWIEEQKVKSG